MFKGRVEKVSHEGGLLVSYTGACPALGSVMVDSSETYIGKVDGVIGNLENSLVHVAHLDRKANPNGMVGLEITIRTRKPKENYRSRDNNRSNDNRRGRNDRHSSGDRRGREERGDRRSRDDRRGGRSRDDRGGNRRDRTTTVAKMIHTLETIGIVANVETQTSHSEPNVIDAVLQKAAKAGALLDNGVETIGDPVIETTPHSQDLEIGNVANAKK